MEKDKLMENNRETHKNAASEMQKASQMIINEMKKVIVGKDDILKKVLMTILAGGHILLEDVPGVGKTTLALGLSRVLNLDYRRMQFTPDTMASDITGFSVYNRETGGLEYKPGAALCNLFLADEINRTSANTGSAAGSNGRGRRHRGRDHSQDAGSVHMYSDAEPAEQRRHAETAGFAAGQVHGETFHGIS